MLSFPAIHVGDPLSHHALTVFPLFAESKNEADYLLSDKALAEGTVMVEEVNEAGSVPNLVVNNLTESPVLFLEGEELRGAKQNRVLNTSVLVAPRSKTTIPVSCVEQGRWRYQGKYFASGGSHASSKLRYVLKKSVTQSAKQGRGHSSDQGEVWKEVGRQMNSLGSHSATGAMADTYETYQNRLVEFRDRLKYVEGATGMAVGIGKKIVSVDVFDKPSTCREVWDRLLTGVILDALEAGATENRADAASAQESLSLLRDAPWQNTAAVGAGEEYRFDTKDDKHGSALAFKDTVVHGSLIVAE
jgi:hypothetical protein